MPDFLRWFVSQPNCLAQGRDQLATRSGGHHMFQSIFGVRTQYPLERKSLRPRIEQSGSSIPNSFQLLPRCAAFVALHSCQWEHSDVRSSKSLQSISEGFWSCIRTTLTRDDGSTGHSGLWSDLSAVSEVISTSISLDVGRESHFAEHKKGPIFLVHRHKQPQCLTTLKQTHLPLDLV